MRVIIAGCRWYNDWDNFCRVVDGFSSSKFKITQVISGGCRGTDKMSERYSELRNIPLRLFLANWSLGSYAGPLRNEQMAANADALIAFWDMESRGTRHMIKEANKRGLHVHIHRIIRPVEGMDEYNLFSGI